MREDKSCPGCHFNHHEDSPRLKLHQEVGFPALAKHGYICRKDVTVSEQVIDKFNNKFPNMKDQSRTSKPVSKRVSDDLSSDHVFAIRVHSPSISNSTLDSSMSPAPIENNLILMPKQAAPITTSNRYADIYSSDSEDDLVFKEMVSDYKTVNSINTHHIVPPHLTIARTPTKVLKKQSKTRGKKNIATIKQSQSDTTASDGFLSTALH